MTPYRLFLAIDLTIYDELQKQFIHQEFYRFTQDLRFKKIDFMSNCNKFYIEAIKDIIKKEDIFRD